MDELLESLADQTWENLEIICLTEDSSNIKTDADLSIKEFNDFNINDINGEYVIFADISDKYYMVGLESLLDYSLANDLELQLYSPINYDMKTKEIYERDLDVLKGVSRSVKKEVFSCEDLSKHLFLLNPKISSIFYKKSFLEDFLSDENFSSPLNNKYLFFKSILNSNKIGIFKKPVYIKKDCSRYELKNSGLSNEHYYNLEDCSIDEIDSLNDKICDLFKKSNQYEQHKDDLANLKMDLYKEFLSNEKSDIDFEHIKDDLNSNYDVSNFNDNNASAYKSILNSNSFDESLLTLRIYDSMNRILDNIIKIDFNDIDEYDFPKDELFGLMVFIDSVPYCFTIRFASKNDNLLCFGPGAQNRNVEGKVITPPYFQRWSWHDEFAESVITYADPSYFYDEDIRIGWFVGERSRWYLENVALIIEKLSQNNNTEPQNILFYGSSAGGFVSIALATLIQGSKALVNNSQFILMNYEEEHLNRLFNYLKRTFGDLSRDEIISLIDYRINLIELFKKQGYVPQISYYVNSESKRDIYNQCIPFIDEISKLDFFDNKLDIHFYKEIRDTPHSPLGKKKIVPILKSFSNQSNVKNEKNDSDEIIKLQKELKKQKELNKKLLSSNSWKLLAPVRKLKKFFKE